MRMDVYTRRGQWGWEERVEGEGKLRWNDMQQHKPGLTLKSENRLGRPGHQLGLQGRGGAGHAWSPGRPPCSGAGGISESAGDAWVPHQLPSVPLPTRGHLANTQRPTWHLGKDRNSSFPHLLSPPGPVWGEA